LAETALGYHPPVELPGKKIGLDHFGPGTVGEAPWTWAAPTNSLRTVGFVPAWNAATIRATPPPVVPETAFRVAGAGNVGETTARKRIPAPSPIARRCVWAICSGWMSRSTGSNRTSSRPPGGPCGTSAPLEEKEGGRGGRNGPRRPPAACFEGSGSDPLRDLTAAAANRTRARTGEGRDRFARSGSPKRFPAPQRTRAVRTPRGRPRCGRGPQAPTGVRRVSSAGPTSRPRPRSGRVVQADPDSTVELPSCFRQNSGHAAVCGLRYQQAGRGVRRRAQAHALPEPPTADQVRPLVPTLFPHVPRAPSTRIRAGRRFCLAECFRREAGGPLGRDRSEQPVTGLHQIRPLNGDPPRSWSQVGSVPVPPVRRCAPGRRWSDRIVTRLAPSPILARCAPTDGRRPPPLPRPRRR